MVTTKEKEKNNPENEKTSIKKNTQKSEELISNNPANELKAIFNPSTELPIKCLLEGKRSFIEDRKWAGLRAAEIVEKKYGGYDNVNNEQLSQSFKQAWEEQVAFCKAAFRVNKALSEDAVNPEQNKSEI